MADGDTSSFDLAPETAQDDGPMRRESARPVRTGGGGVAIFFVGVTAYYGFWILVSIATGHDMSTLRWSIPFMLISLTVCVLSVGAFSQLDRLSSYGVGRGWAQVGKAVSVTQGVLALLMVLGVLGTVVGLIITIVGAIDVRLMA